MKQHAIRSKCPLAVFAPYAAVFPLATALVACSGDTVVMGEDDPGSISLPSTSRCLASTTLTGDLVVETQEDLATFEGCQHIDGSLTIRAAVTDLRPLHALTSVRTTLLIQGHFASLAGLESLQTVGNLEIDGLVAGDLAPLGNLEFMTIGKLSLKSCPNLIDLEGLGELAGVRHLWLECSALETFAPLGLPEQMADIWVFDSDLTQLADLGVVELSGTLAISRSELQNLDAFSALKRVGGIELRQNARVENMDGVSGLERAGRIAVIDNPLFTHLPVLSTIWLGELWITGNDRLAAWPELPQSLWDRAAPPSPFIGRAPFIEITDNPLLPSVTLPFNWLDGSGVIISDNASLTHVSFSESSLSALVITNNPVLASVNIELGTAGVLDVSDNPLLDASIFDAVRSLERRVEGNADVP